MNKIIEQIYKGILFGFGFVCMIMLGNYITNAWNYSDPQTVTTNDTLTATGWNAMVESLFWKRDGANDISFTAGNASVNAPSADAHIATKKYVDDSISGVIGGMGGDEIPSGAVMAFDLSTCPDGWTVYTTGQGRYIVGLPNGGTLEATVGTALSNQENRATGKHNHLVDPPSATTSSAGNHSHDVPNLNYDSSTYIPHDPNRMGADFTARSNAESTTTAGAHSHTINIGGFNSDNAGSIAGTNAPYVQLLLCKKQ